MSTVAGLCRSQGGASCRKGCRAAATDLAVLDSVPRLPSHSMLPFPLPLSSPALPPASRLASADSMLSGVINCSVNRPEQALHPPTLPPSPSPFSPLPPPLPATCATWLTSADSISSRGTLGATAFMHCSVNECSLALRPCPSAPLVHPSPCVPFPSCSKSYLCGFHFVRGHVGLLDELHSKQALPLPLPPPSLPFSPSFPLRATILTSADSILSGGTLASLMNCSVKGRCSSADTCKRRRTQTGHSCIRWKHSAR